MTTNPFFTLITRACWRPKMLANSIRSALSQVDTDLEILFIVDMKKRGVRWANDQFHANRDRIQGQYVFMLDDDCRLIHNGFVGALKKITTTNPGLVMVRTRRPQLAPKELPRREHWGKVSSLKQGSTNGMCYVTRTDLWKKYTPRYFVNATGDWQFLKALLPNAKPIVWLDMFASETQQLGRGKAFEKCNAEWWQNIVKRFQIEKDDREWHIPLYQWDSEKIKSILKATK